MKFNKMVSKFLVVVILLGLFTFPALADDTMAALPSAPPTSKPARYPEKGALFGYGDDGIAELQFNARYMFEQSVLASTVLAYENETIDYMNASNITKMKENILSIWELAAAEVIFSDATLSGEKVDIGDADAFWALVDERRPFFGLGDEHIVAVTMETLESDTNAIIVELLDTHWTMLSTYIAIAHNETAGLKIFTLEKSVGLMDTGTVPYMFCYVEGDSRGSYGIIDNDRQAFINAIKDVMGQ